MEVHRNDADSELADDTPMINSNNTEQQISFNIDNSWTHGEDHSDHEEDDVRGSDTSDEDINVNLNGNNSVEYQRNPTQNTDPTSLSYSSLVGNFIGISNIRDLHHQLELNNQLNNFQSFDVLQRLSMQVREMNGGVSEPDATHAFNSVLSQNATFPVPSTSNSQPQNLSLSQHLNQMRNLSQQHNLSQSLEAARKQLASISQQSLIQGQNRIPSQAATPIHPQNPSHLHNLAHPQNIARPQNLAQPQNLSQPQNQTLQNAVSFTPPNPSDGEPTSNSSAQSNETANSRSTPQQNREWCQEEQYKQVRMLYELSADPERKEFLDKMFQYMCDISRPINRLPIMAKAVLDLYMLFKLVVARGGLVEVINKKLWQEIIKGLELPSSITSAAFTLRTQYMKYLYPYECKVHNFSTKEQLQMAIDGNKREGRSRSFNQAGPSHMQQLQMQQPHQNGAQIPPMQLGAQATIPQAHHSMLPGPSSLPLAHPHMQQLPLMPQMQHMQNLATQENYNLFQLLTYFNMFTNEKRDYTQRNALQSLDMQRDAIWQQSAASAFPTNPVPNDEPQREALNLSENSPDIPRRKRRRSTEGAGPSRRPTVPVTSETYAVSDERSSPIFNVSSIDNSSPIDNRSPIHNSSPNGLPVYNSLPIRNRLLNESPPKRKPYSKLEYEVLNPGADEQKMVIQIKVNGVLFKGEIDSVDPSCSSSSSSPSSKRTTPN